MAARDRLAVVKRELRRREMIAGLREVAQRVGPNVTLARFCRETGISDFSVYRVFDDWGALRQRAGLTAEVERGRPRYSAEELLAELRWVADEAGEDVTATEFTRRTGISMGPVERLFGKWSAFRKAAGLKEVPKGGPRPRFTRKEILDELLRLVTERGDVTQDEFCREVGISTRTVARFGRWCSLRKELKLPKRACTGRPLWETMVVGELWDPEVEMTAGLGRVDVNDGDERVSE